MSDRPQPVEAPAASPLPEIAQVTLGELWASLKAGLWDFRRAPAFGLFFSGVYVLCGFGLIWIGAGHFVWTLVLSLGFPLIAPFAAVGLYEVSRRLEAGQPLVWSEVLGVVVGEKDRQLPWLGAIVVIIFLFWSFLAHMIFALFMGPSTLTNITSSFEALMTPTGYVMIGVELAVGGATAFLVFAVTVMGMPLLLDKEIDFVSAMLLSMRTVARNLGVMLLWAAVIAVLLFLGLLPMFLGLLIVLPVLGHATWHLYRRALYDPA